MKQKGFLGGRYISSVPNFDCADTVNLYPEMDEIGTGKDQEVLMLRSRPGLTLLHRIPRSPIRCVWQTQNGYIYVVAGNGVFHLTTTDGINYTHALIATLTTQTGHVYMTDEIPNVVNGQVNTARVVQVVVVDGSTTGICFNEGSDANLTLLGPGNGYQGSSFVTAQDGFFLFAQPNTPVAYFAADPLNISGTDTIVVNLGPDVISRVISDHDIIWVFGRKTISVWQNTGGVGFFSPFNLFQQIPGSFSEGGAFPHTIIKLGGQLLWVQSDPNGSGQVFEAIGFRGTRISTHSEELLLGQYDLTNATAWSYTIEGHSFYCLNVPGMPKTLCYDLNTKMWSTRVFFQNGLQSRDLVEHHYNLNLPGISQIHMVGDYQSGNLYRLDNSNYTDNGQPILRQRTTSHLSSEYKRMQIQKLQVDIEPGTGLDGLGLSVQEGTIGLPVLQSATNLELIGNGPTYQFAGADGTVVTPVGTPTITASGVYSNSYQINGNLFTALPGVFEIGPEQIGIGDGTTSNYNLSSNYGTDVESAIIYANDWRGNILQLQTPRTNLLPYSGGGEGGGGFSLGWVEQGVNAIPAANSGATNTTSAVTQVSAPTPNSPTQSATDTTIQNGWSQYVYSIAARPTLLTALDNIGTYVQNGTFPNGTGLALANSVSSPFNYLSGTNFGVIANYVPNHPYGETGPAIPLVRYPSGYEFAGFGFGQNLTGSLEMTIQTTTMMSQAALATSTSSVACSEVDVQYMADQMTEWVTIATGCASSDISATIPVSVNLTISNLNTLKVQVVQTCQWFNRSGQGGTPSGDTNINWTSAFQVYDCAFLIATQYSLDAPDGTSTGVALVEDNSTGYHNVTTTYNSTHGSPVSMSVYALLGDANRNIQLQIGSSPLISAGSIFSLGSAITGQAPSVVSTSVGTAGITYQTQAIPSTGVILTNTLVLSNQTGLTAQIAPSVLQTPTNGNVITYLWSFVSGGGATITSGLTSPLISFNVTTPGNLSLQCIITTNGVQTIFTQFIAVVASTQIVRLYISGTEAAPTGSNTALIGLVNPTNGLDWAMRQSYYLPTDTLANVVDTTTTCAPGALLSALMPFFTTQSVSGCSWAWTIQNGTILTPATYPSICFTAGTVGAGGQNGVCAVSCTFTTDDVNNQAPTVTNAAYITILPSMQVFYQGYDSGYINIWGCQVEEAATPTSFIATIGQPLTDLYTLNSQTGTVIFGVAPLEDSVLTAQFQITEVSPNPVEFYWSGQYYEALPNMIQIGTNPQLSLNYSMDGGKTWTPPEAVPMGRIGADQTQCIWRRLRQARDRVWRITCSDPVSLSLIGHSIDAKVSRN